MVLKDFLKKDNVNTLWDVISDEDIFKYLTCDIQDKVYNIFISNIQGFFDTEKTKPISLIELNKKYILLILNHIKTNYPHIQPSKIKIYQEEPAKELITYHDIQQNRASQFEQDFNKVHEDFKNAMTLPIPQKPEFADNSKDQPIKEMDKILKDMVEKRNYEVEQINRNFVVNTGQVDNWLKPQETSVKTDKNIYQSEQSQQSKQSQQSQQSNNRLKYITQDGNLKQEEGKKVSWGKDKIYEASDSNQENIELIYENNDKENGEENDDINIFAKLKKTSNQNSDAPYKTEDRIAILERNVDELNKKIDQIFQLLQSKNL